MADENKVQEQVFYIGDRPPINISEWATEIALEAGLNNPKKIPFTIFKLAGWFGDILGMFGVKFPMTSFRLKNMTTDHIVNLDNTYNVCGDVPFNRKCAVTAPISYRWC